LNSPGNVDIDAPEAWSVTTGSPSTIVAVIDTGVDLTNPQLVSRLWVNAAASKPHNTVFGWNFVSNNGNVQDVNGHGTHVTGILAATGNNGQGVAGVDWHSQIMPLKILDSTGSGSLDAAVSAVYFAAQHGARVINASWGSAAPDPALGDAIRYADQRGVVFVNAAGNDSANNDIVPTYPAAYRTPNMLVVTAVDQAGNLASFSNYGSQTVDLAAPGVDILSTYPKRLGGYATLSGTSMSTPFVTGVVSLLAGLHPTWTAEQLVQRVLATTKPLAGLAGKTVTSGIVDAAQAVGVAGSGPNGDHYPGPPISKTSVTHSGPVHKTRTRTSHKAPHGHIKNRSLGAHDRFDVLSRLPRYALNQTHRKTSSLLKSETIM
jgi:subtilisin family serine protease